MSNDTGLYNLYVNLIILEKTKKWKQVPLMSFTQDYEFNHKKKIFENLPVSCGYLHLEN